MQKHHVALLLTLDSVLKIFSGLFILKVISSEAPILLANFSQIKQVSAALIALTSSVMMIGINKLYLQKKAQFSSSVIFHNLLFLLIFILAVTFYCLDFVVEVVGQSEGVLYVLVLGGCLGFISNYCLGMHVKNKNTLRISIGKLFATIGSLFGFVTIDSLAVGLWESLLFYLIFYYALLSLVLYEKVFFNLDCDIVSCFSIDLELIKIYFLVLISSVTFPLSIIYFRYELALQFSWNYVSFWEVEWQIASLALIVLTPVISLIVTTKVSSLYVGNCLNKLHGLKLVFGLVLLGFFASIALFFMRGIAVDLFYAGEVFNSNIVILLLINIIRIASVTLYYFLYVYVKPIVLLLSEIIYLVCFYFVLMNFDSNSGGGAILAGCLFSYIYLMGVLYYSKIPQ